MAPVPRRLASAALVLAVALAGCAAEPVVKEPGSIEPGEATFRLTVDVAAALATAERIVGASVSAGDALGQRTSGTTGADGVVVLELAAPQVVAIEVVAPGYAGALTVPMHVGDMPGADVGSQVVGAFVCAFSLGLACPIDATRRLPGEEGRIEVRLVPESLAREADVALDASVTSPATGQTGAFAEIPFTGVAELDALYADQLVRVEGVLSWTNEPGKHADLEFFLGCGDAWVSTEQGSPSALATLGPRELSLAIEPTPPCAPLVAGAWVDSASTGMNARATLALRFGPGVQDPT